MTEPDEPSEAPPAAAHGNSFQRIGGVVIAPDSTLQRIAARPDVLIPMLLIIAVSVIASFIVTPRLDIETQMRAQFEKQHLPAEKQEQAIAIAEKIKSFTAVLSAASVPVVLVVIASVYLLVFKVFGLDGGFKQFLSITTYAWIPQVIKSIILTALLLPRRSLTPIEFQALLKSNLGFLADPEASPALFALLASVDLFSAWTLFLLVVGFSWASKTPRGKTAAFVISIFVVYVLVRVGLAAISGGGMG